MTGRWLDAESAAAYLNVRVEQLQRWTREGRVPTPSYQLGPRRPRWDREALDAAMRNAFAGEHSLDATAATKAYCEQLVRERAERFRKRSVARAKPR